MSKTNQYLMYPFLLALYPTISLYANNISEIYFTSVLLPAVISLASVLILYFGALRTSKDPHAAGVLILVGLVAFFSYGHVYDLLSNSFFEERWVLAGVNFGRHAYFLVFWLGLTFAAAFLSSKLPVRLEYLTTFLNALAVFLVLSSAADIGRKEFRARSSWLSKQDTVTQLVATGTDHPLEDIPDIYYIILDGYGNSHSLKQSLDFDNKEFLDALAARGGYVASRSLCNYPQTYLSLASSLNMEYLNHLTKTMGQESEDRRIFFRLVSDNKVTRFLKSKGFKILHFSSGLGITLFNPLADINFEYHRYFDDFSVILLKGTLARPLIDRLDIDDKRERINFTFQKLATIPHIKGPKFTFAHIYIPHFPYVFGRKGEPVPQGKIEDNPWAPKQRYLDQLIFTNKKILTLVDSLQAESKNPPIIILQGDHGPVFTGDSTLIERSAAMYQERIPIFNAYFLPEKAKGLLYDTVSPVNSFRLVFDAYFKTNFGLLKDLSYFSDYKSPYKFIPANDLVSFEEE